MCGATAVYWVRKFQMIVLLAAVLPQLCICDCSASGRLDGQRLDPVRRALYVAKVFSAHTHLGDVALFCWSRNWW